MTKQHFGTSHVPLSPAVRAGDFVFVSGQVPVVDGKIVEGGIGPQTRKVLENIAAALALAGCELSDVVKTTVWLKHAEDFAGFNAAYAPFFPKRPAGALDRRVAADDRHLGRDRGHRLQAPLEFLTTGALSRHPARRRC